jgi:uncharacterized protein
MGSRFSHSLVPIAPCPIPYEVSMFHEMTVVGFTLDSLAHRPVVILKDAQDYNTVPLWLNTADAVAMAAELVGRDLSDHQNRQDLFTALLGSLGMKARQVVIEGVRDGIYRASVRFEQNGEELRVEVRPCEALLASLKYKLPVLVAAAVVEEASRLMGNEEQVVQENDARRFVDFLENLDPATMGKYPM